MTIQNLKEVVPCLLCGEQKDATAFVVRRDPLLVEMRDATPMTRYGVCKQCGLVFQNPRITREVESALYTSGEYRGFSKNPPQDWLDRHLWFAEREVRWIQKHLGEPSGRRGRALEVGAGAGFGVVALERAGWTAVGVEPDQDVAAFGRSYYGVNVLGEFFTEESFPGEKFSLIFTYQVFEHLLDPFEILRACRKKIESDGVLYIHVPTFRQCYRKPSWLWFGSAHICMFTHKTLGNFLARAGFEILKYEYSDIGELRVLAKPSAVLETLPYRERWYRVPPEIFLQGTVYLVTRQLPYRAAQKVKSVLYSLLGKERGELFVRGLIAIKRKLGVDFY